MYKGRLKIWAGAISLCVLISLCITAIGKIAESISYKVEVNTQVNVESDERFISRFNEKKLGSYAFHINDDPGIIFADSSDEVKAGYTKYPELVYSGLVMYVRNSISTNNSGFIPTSPYTSSEYHPYKIDLLEVLQAMEESMSWKDLGMSNKVIKGDVTLYIPKETDPWYPSVEELFYITLNNGNIPTEQEREALVPRVDRLLNKCIKVTSVMQGIMEEYAEPSKDYKVFIAPEFLANEGNCFSKNNTDAFVQVYFQKTVFQYIDVFVKNDSNLTPFIDFMKNNPKFMIKTGWRIQNNNYNIRDRVSVRYIDFM